MRIDHEKRVIKFRQSWLNENLICAERSRRSLTDPDLFVSSDAAILGTGVHAYAETRLAGESIPVAMAAAFAALDAEFLLVHSNVKMTDAEVYTFMPRMCASFERDLLPIIPPGGQIEVPFDLPLFEWHGHTVRMTGRIDYVDLTGKVWDWKTSGQEYKRWEKERWAIQPTVYAWAASSLGLAESWPVEFEYSIVLKSPVKAPKTQRVWFTRTLEHMGFLQTQIKALLANYINLSTPQHLSLRAGPWPLNDQHALCSKTWCPVFAECKGQWVDI